MLKRRALLWRMATMVAGVGVAQPGTAAPSKADKVLIMRLQAVALDQRTASHAPEGIAVYSAICTHEACDVSAWLEQQKQLMCECHLSRFNPYKFGKVGGGPATRKLPMLPIRVEHGRIVVAGPFTKRPGPARK